MLKSTKKFLNLLAVVIIGSLAAVPANADESAKSWDFESYAKQFSSDTPITESSYAEFPDLEFSIDSAKPNCWNVYNKQYGIALYSQNSGNNVKFTPMQSGTLSLTALYKKIDTNPRWLSVDTSESPSAFNYIFDLQNDTSENKVTTKQTRTVELTAGTTYYIHGHNIVFTSMSFAGEGPMITPEPTPTPEPVLIDKAETGASVLNYAVSVNYNETESDLYVAVYNEDGSLFAVRKNQKSGKIDITSEQKYTVKAMLWEKGTVMPIAAAETESEKATLKGKTVYAFGDSIVYGHTAPDKSFMRIIANEEKMTLKMNAVNGATVVAGRGNDIITQVKKVAASETEPDFIVFDGYTNDAYEGILENLGTMQGKSASAFDNKTFCGGFEEIIYTMKQKWPNAKLVFVTIHKSAARDWDIQCALRETAMEICGEWGVDVVDIFTDASLDTRDASQMSKYIIGANGSHPNEVGCREFYVPHVKEKLSYLINMPSASNK